MVLSPVVLPCAASIAAAAVLTAACGPTEIPGVQVGMDFSRADDFYSAPFPSADLAAANGHYDLSDFPGQREVDFLRPAFKLIQEDNDGAGVASAIYFRMTSAIDRAQLPGLGRSVADGGPIYLVDVDPDSPDYLSRIPFVAQFRDSVDGGLANDNGYYGTDRQLSLLPLQGVPLRPHTRYGAVILRDLRDADGNMLGVSADMADLAAGYRPAALSEPAFAEYSAAVDALIVAGIRPRNISGLAVFRTGDPTAQTRTVFAHAAKNLLPTLSRPLTLGIVYEEYCTYETTVDMPVYQEGEPPYFTSGGRWAFDDRGVPMVQVHERARVLITLPRSPPPSAGFPLVVFVRTGGGGNSPLTDRGTTDVPLGEPLVPGTGPAHFFARAGFAGLSVDGPHGGLRNPSGADEQFLVFNVLNPSALRDNIRQSAIELALLPAMLEDFTVNAADCPGLATTVSFDLDTLAMMGHSMGATIAPLVLALEPRYRAMILSGAGGSYIANIMYKQAPIRVRDMAEFFMGYEAGALYEHDPILSIIQWAADSADPVPYLRELLAEPGAAGRRRHVLMLQGIVDTYIMPPIANATSLGLGLDLAGEALDSTVAELAGFIPLADLLPFGGGQRIDLPVSGNVGGDTTAVVIQHREDFIQNGHEVVFQRDAPKAQYECFLRTFARGVPHVPAGAGPDPACD